MSLISSEEGIEEEEEDQFLSDEQLQNSLEEDSDEDSNMSSSSEIEDDDDDDDNDNDNENDGKNTNGNSSGNKGPYSSSSANNSTTNYHLHNNHHHHHNVNAPTPPTTTAQQQMLSFGPPYYGRPPTPLPPSPSLTSLLRPSRPTTPDASDDEHGHSHGHVVGGGGIHSTSVGGHDPVPRASPKVPTYEYYGFVLYLFSSLCFLIYLLWSYLPSPFLHVLGIYYYPNRWWSLAIPSFLVMTLVYIYVALALYNTEYLTLPLQSLETIVDEAGKIAVLDSRGRIVTSEERRRNIERERERVEKEAQQAGGDGGSGSSKGHRHHQRNKSSGSNGYHGGGGLHFFAPREIDWRECWNEGTDAVMDVPLAGVCEVLYGGAKGVGEDELGIT